MSWEAVDERTSRAFLVDGSVKIDLLFAFDEDGLVESVSAASRNRQVKGGVEATPWMGKFSNYKEHEGMLIPMEGEVMWMLPTGEKPYWRGHISDIQYEFASTRPSKPNVD